MSTICRQTKFLQQLNADDGFIYENPCIDNWELFCQCIRNGLIKRIDLTSLILPKYAYMLFQSLKHPNNVVKALSLAITKKCQVVAFMDFLKSPNCKLTNLCCGDSTPELVCCLCEYLANGNSQIKSLSIFAISLDIDDDYDDLYLLSSVLHLISSWKSPVRDFVFSGLGHFDNASRELINGALESQSCQLTYFYNPMIGMSYLSRFKIRQKKRRLMVSIALVCCSYQAGQTSTLRRFPIELQRMLSDFL